MSESVGILGATQVLAHAPELVFSGSKPSREISRDGGLHDRIADSLRSYEDAAAYRPNQVFIGAARPESLTSPSRPWWDSLDGARDLGLAGMMFDQDELLGAMARIDSAGLLSLADGRGVPGDGRPQAGIVESLAATNRDTTTTSESAEPIPGRDGPLGWMRWGYPADDALAPRVVLENLATKATAALALALLVERREIAAESLGLVLSCSEEAVGDRYQRGGGNLGKAVAESVGATEASGFDVKNFCAAPIPALVVASSLVRTGVAERIAVVAGGSLPKLGMKFLGHLSHGMPVLEDVLGGLAVVVGRGDRGPAVRMDAVGRHSVSAGGSNQAIFGQLFIDPLERAGLTPVDVDVLGTELHNPEVTEPQGSGDVPLRNYRMMAALAARGGYLDRGGIDEYLARRCFAGFAPTQGHLASAVCLLPHILSEMDAGAARRAQLIAKGSLFLGKMSTLSDGMSVLLERQ